MTYQRIAFVLNALTGEKLKASKPDVGRVYSLLTAPELGGCSIDSPKPLYECQSRNEFWDAFSFTLAQWRVEDQLLFYFFGHGNICRNQYCLKLGQDFLIFKALISELEAAGVYKAILILDTCHSNVVPSVKKNSHHAFPTINQAAIPHGIAIIASSLPSQYNYELSNGFANVFTKLLCQGIETGLDQQATKDGLITISDMTHYITEKLKSDEQYSYLEYPVYSIDGAGRERWIAKNPSGHLATSLETDASSVKPLKELKFLYKQTAPDEHSCINANLDDLDWNLVEEYANAAHPGLFQASGNREEILFKLGFYSQIPYQGKLVLHKSAVLCFCHRPDRIYSQAKSLFVIGNPRGKFTKRQITGPLKKQINALVELTERYLNKQAHIAINGLRREMAKTHQVIRELISNAVIHRNYELSGTVIVMITPNTVEIRNPGRFPPESSWATFLENTTIYSSPTNTIISQYMANLRVFEGIGRGFKVFKQYLEENGSYSLTGTELPGQTTDIHLLCGRRSGFLVAALKGWLGPLAFEFEWILENAVEAFLDNHFNTKKVYSDQKKAAKYAIANAYEEWIIAIIRHLKTESNTDKPIKQFIKDHQANLEVFLQDLEVAEELLQPFFTKTMTIDSHHLASRWQALKLQALPTEFDLVKINNVYLQRIKETGMVTNELREFFQLQLT